ncbi:TRAP transporter large permease [Geminicoccaceae bacterium 1502E]|nr:TRAP transporter large permease [Geminicoccaceae bacterium 1502E]
MLTTVAIVFFVLLFAGVPIAFVLGITALVPIVMGFGLDFLALVPQRMFAALNLFTIMAIPFFFLAAELMSASRITEDLVRFAEVLVGRIKGGLAHVNVLASAFFAGISGSAISDVAGLGAIEIKAMRQAGYPLPFATALTVASSLIGPMIPPSIILVLYGSIMQVSIAALFLAGVLPGLVMALLLMAMIRAMADRQGFPRRTEPLPPGEAGRAVRGALVGLMMPAIILGGILSGAFTPTEAAAVAVAYALLVGFLVKRSLRFGDLPPIMLRVSIMTAVVFMVLACANILAWFIALDRVPEAIARGLMSIASDPYALLLLVNLLLLGIGMFMDIGAAIIVMAPIIGPVMVDAGVHPVHFGVVMSLNLVLGLSTPPVGPCLFAAAGITGMRIETLSKALLPFYLVQVVFLLIVTYVPFLSLGLPRLFGYIN